MKDELFDQIRARVPTHGAFGLKTDLVADTDLDSVELLELIADLEDAYGVHLDDEALQAVVTVGDLIDAVHRRAGN